MSIDRINEIEKGIVIAIEDEDRFRFWNPKEGDIIVGSFIKLRSRKNKYGTAKIVVLRDKEGLVWGIFATKDIRDQLQDKKLHQGDIVALKRCPNYGRMQKYILKIESI